MENSEKIAGDPPANEILAFSKSEIEAKIIGRLSSFLSKLRAGREKDKFWMNYRLSAPKMGRYENGKERPSLFKLIEICEKTQLSANWLLLGIGPETLNVSESNQKKVISTSGNRETLPGQSPDGDTHLLKRSTNEADDVMTIDQAAKYLKVSRNTMLKLAKNKRIPGMKVGRQWRFSRKRLDEYMNGRLQ